MTVANLRLRSAGESEMIEGVRDIEMANAKYSAHVAERYPRSAQEDEGKVRLSSKSIIDDLLEMETRPWAEFTRAGKPITPLKPFKIRPRTVHDASGKKVAGFCSEWFDDAWKRYLSSDETQIERSRPARVDKNDDEGDNEHTRARLRRSLRNAVAKRNEVDR